MRFSFNWSLPHDPSVAVMKVMDWLRVAMYYMGLGLPGLFETPKQDTSDDVSLSNTLQTLL